MGPRAVDMGPVKDVEDEGEAEQKLEFAEQTVDVDRHKHEDRACKLCFRYNRITGYEELMVFVDVKTGEWMFFGDGFSEQSMLLEYGDHTYIRKFVPMNEENIRLLHQQHGQLALDILERVIKRNEVRKAAMEAIRGELLMSMSVVKRVVWQVEHGKKKLTEEDAWELVELKGASYLVSNLHRFEDLGNVTANNMLGANLSIDEVRTVIGELAKDPIHSAFHFFRNSTRKEYIARFEQKLAEFT